MDSVILIPYYAGGLFVWPLFRLFRRTADPRSKRFGTVFLITSLALGGLAAIAASVGDEQWWGTGLFPWLNFVSLMFSAQTLIAGSEASPDLFQEPKLAAAFAVLFVVTGMLFCLGGFRIIDITVHEARATATVIGKGGKGLKYRYEVAGRAYTGGGDPGNPPYPQGSSFEIRYSSAHPHFSTAHNPMDFFGQMLVASLFAGFGAFCITRSRMIETSQRR